MEKLSHLDMFGTAQILSVDDEEVNQMVLEEILVSSGYVYARYSGWRGGKLCVYGGGGGGEGETDGLCMAWGGGGERWCWMGGGMLTPTLLYAVRRYAHPVCCPRTLHLDGLQALCVAPGPFTWMASRPCVLPQGPGLTCV